MITRDHCPICGSSDIERLFDLNDYPTFMGCVSSPVEDDHKEDQKWSICKRSGTLFLQDLAPLEFVYPLQHNASVGRLWSEHHSAFAEFIHKNSPETVLEIGGAHGILSRDYHAIDCECDWTIIEPNPVPAKGVNASIIKGFFDEKFVFQKPLDAIVHSHVFEHVYDPKKFIKHISGFLPKGKHLLFSLPNMMEMLKRKYTNCINFEHTIFLTEPYIEYLLHKNGFRIIRKEYFLDDHSIFYDCIKDSFVQAGNLPDGLYQQNKQLYMEYVRYHEVLINDLNERISELKDGQALYLFGAHVFAQYLIGFGLNTERIEFILDNDLNKQERRLYGTSLMVASPSVLQDIEKPVVILKAGVYNNEIKKDIIENINSRVLFLE